MVTPAAESAARKTSEEKYVIFMVCCSVFSATNPDVEKRERTERC